jgi:hypothetical protein
LVEGVITHMQAIAERADRRTTGGLLLARQVYYLIGFDAPPPRVIQENGSTPQALMRSAMITSGCHGTAPRFLQRPERAGPG